MTVSPAKREGRAIALFVAVVVAVMCILAGLHLAYADVRVGGVYWFNLDKERNLPTWFSGSLFFLFSAVAAASFHAERYLNQSRDGNFRYSVLWLGAAAVGVFLSLDEILVLHENLFWREVRHGTQQLGGAWLYVTQWQLLYLPLFLVIFPALIVFFLNRLACDPKSLAAALSGVAAWLIALLLEALRQPAQAAGTVAYEMSVVVEEELEMLGALLVVTAVLLYLRTVLFRLAPEELARIGRGYYLSTRRTVTALFAFGAFVAVAVSLVFVLTRRLEKTQAPIPYLQEQVLRSRH